MIKGVVFDLDHTLFDRYATLEECAPLLYEKFGKHLAPGLGIEDVAVTMIYADKNYNVLGWKTVLKYLNESGFFKIPMDIDKYTEIILDTFSKFAVQYDFTYDVLYEIRKKNFKIGLITNGRQEIQMSKLKMLGIEKYFDEIVICSQPELKKPNLLPFELMSKRLDIAPQELLYVGDHPKNDVDASRRAGYTPVWVRTYDLWPFDDIEKCEYQVNTVKEIPKLLKKIRTV